MSEQYCENYDVKRETVHCCPRNVDRCCTWSDVAWCCRWNLSAFFKICFCFVLLYIKSLNDWSLREQWIFFPSNLNVSFDTLRFSGNKIHCSPQDQSLNDKCLTFIDFNNSLFLAVNINRFTPRVVRLLGNSWLEERQLQVIWDPGHLGSENQTAAVHLARFSMRNSTVVFDSMFTLVTEQPNTGEANFIVPKGEGQG